MITAGLNGRLGNEMFQIAVATALALKNNDIAQFNLEVTPYGKKYKKISGFRGWRGHFFFFIFFFIPFFFFFFFYFIFFF